MKAIVIALSALICAGSALAAPKSYKDTKDFASRPRTHLNEKFDTYGAMAASPKGTDCDWVFVAQDFSLADLTTTTVKFYASTVDQNAYFSGLWNNQVLGTFEQALHNLGVQTERADGGYAAGQRNESNQIPPEVLRAQQQWAAAQVEGLKRSPQGMEMMVNQRLEAEGRGLAGQVELDLYHEDKAKLGVEEAAKRMEARRTARREAIRAEIMSKTVTPEDIGGGSAASAPAPAASSSPKRPEEQPGYVLVCYVPEADDNASNPGVIIFSPVSRNYTTGEFILLKDGKPVLAGRHTATDVRVLGAGGRPSGQKCGEALASAFKVKVKKA